MKKTITINISVGEFFDRLTILDIKRNKVGNKKKLDNINKEYAALNQYFMDNVVPTDEVNDLINNLRDVNITLWELENQIRQVDSRGIKEKEFVELAIAIYTENDKRFHIKNRINLMTNSEIIEEKEYS